MSNIDELLVKAREIKNEVEDGRNTAERIGTMFVDIINTIGIYFSKIVTTTSNGLMSATDKAKLDEIEAGAQKNVTIPVATTSANGLMSALDKGNLDNSIIGDEVSADRDNKKVIISYNTNDGTHYSTTIENATPEKAGVMTAADKAKLDGINETLNLIEQKIAIKTALDANSILTSGTYYLKNAANTPSDTCYIEVIAADPNFIVQKSIDTAGVEKKRVYTNNVWSTWK